MLQQPVGYLRPHEVEEAKQERTELEGMLNLPQHLQSHVDIGAVRRHLRSTIQKLEDKTPRATKGEALDSLVKQERELREKITTGMPTQAEMRRNPAGAVTKHRQWEQRSKQDVLLWKDVRLALHASGAVDGGLKDATEIANLERYRPQGGAGELNMDNEQIPGRVIFLPPPGSGPTTVLDRNAVAAAFGEDVAGVIALLTNEQRAQLKAALNERPAKGA